MKQKTAGVYLKMLLDFSHFLKVVKVERFISKQNRLHIMLNRFLARPETDTLLIDEKDWENDRDEQLNLLTRTLKMT